MKFGAVLLLISCAATAAPSLLAREAKGGELAERVILLSKLQFASPSMRSFCRQWRGLCVAPESVELALAFIGMQKDRASVFALVDLLRFRLDAGVGEDYACYVLATRGVGLQALERIDAEKLHGRCLSEVSRMQSDSDVYFRDAEVSYVCAAPESMRSRAVGLASAIRNGRECDSEDF